MFTIIIGILICMAIYFVAKEYIKYSKREKNLNEKEETLDEVKTELDAVRIDSVVMDVKEKLKKEQTILEKREKKLNK